MLDGGAQHLHGLLDGERARTLAGWKFAEALKVLSDQLLRRKKKECMLDKPAHIISCLMLSPLQWIGAQIEQPWQPELHQRLGPDIEAFGPLLEEDGFPLIVAQAGQAATIGPVEELMALVRTLPRQKIALIVTVEMNLEGVAVCFIALQELALDLGLASRGDQGRAPILGRKDLVDLAVRGNVARPANQRRDAVATFPIGVLLTTERSCAAIRPGEYLGPIIGRVDDDGVVGYSQIVQLFQKLPDLAVMLDHAVGIDAEAGDALDSGLRRVQICMRLELNQTKKGLRSLTERSMKLVVASRNSWSTVSMRFFVKGPCPPHFCLPQGPKRESSPGWSVLVAVHFRTPRGPNCARKAGSFG